MKKRNKLIIDITKSALFGESVKHTEPISSKEYVQIYRYARQNGILAICFDGIQNLPKETQPSKRIYMQWIAATASIENRYETEKKVLDYLIETLTPHNIRILLFKGFSISRYYPVPKHREFGDLDIYMFEDYSKSLEILNKEGIHIHTANLHHAQFRIQKILVENHDHFLHNRNPRMEEALRRAALKAREGSQETLIYFPYFENVAYTLLHIAAHYRSHDCHIRFRTITDWALLMKEEGKNWHYSEMKEFIKHSYEVKLMDLLTMVCSEWYDVVSNEVLLQIKPIPEKIQKRFIESIFDKKYQRKDEKCRWIRYCGHIYKHFRYASLRKYLHTKR